MNSISMVSDGYLSLEVPCVSVYRNYNFINFEINNKNNISVNEVLDMSVKNNKISIPDNMEMEIEDKKEISL